MRESRLLLSSCVVLSPLRGLCVRPCGTKIVCIEKEAPCRGRDARGDARGGRGGHTHPTRRQAEVQYMYRRRAERAASDTRPALADRAMPAVAARALWTVTMRTYLLTVIADGRDENFLAASGGEGQDAEVRVDLGDLLEPLHARTARIERVERHLSNFSAAQLAP